jgi:hypothetical protein
LLDILAVVSLPKPVPRESDGTVNIREFTRNGGLHAAQTAAADILLGTEPAATALVAERASHGPSGLRRALGRLLRERGFEAEADAAFEDGGSSSLKALEWLRDYDFSDRKLLAVLADAPVPPPSWTISKTPASMRSRICSKPST